MKSTSLLPEIFSGPINRWSMRSPYREMARMQDRMERMFNDIWNASTADLPWQSSFGEAGYFAPTCDLETTDKQYLLSFDLPGVSKENLKVELIEDQLIVSGERRSEKHEHAAGTEIQARAAGKYYRSFTLPTDVEKGKIQASYQDGVLQIALQRTGEVKTHSIAISDKPLTLAAPSTKGTKVA